MLQRAQRPLDPIPTIRPHFMLRLKLVPGMPVESFIQTGERTIISYLIKPLTDQITKARGARDECI